MFCRIGEKFTAIAFLTYILAFAKFIIVKKIQRNHNLNSTHKFKPYSYESYESQQVLISYVKP